MRHPQTGSTQPIAMRPDGDRDTFTGNMQRKFG